MRSETLSLDVETNINTLVQLVSATRVDIFSRIAVDASKRAVDRLAWVSHNVDCALCRMVSQQADVILKRCKLAEKLERIAFALSDQNARSRAESKQGSGPTPVSTPLSAVQGLVIYGAWLINSSPTRLVPLHCMASSMQDAASMSDAMQTFYKYEFFTVPMLLKFSLYLHIYCSMGVSLGQ